MFDDLTVKELKELIHKELKISQLEIEKTKLAVSEDHQKLYINLEIAYDYIGRHIDSIQKKEDVLYFTRSLMFEVRDLEYKLYTANRDEKVASVTDEYIQKFKDETEDMTPAEVVLYEADTGLEAVRLNIKDGENTISEDDIRSLTLCAEKLRLALESGDDVMIALEQRSTDDEIQKLLGKMLDSGYGV